MTDLSATWLGRRELSVDTCALPLVRRLAALLVALGMARALS